VRKYRSFRDDEQLAKKLDEIPKNERSTIIRMALRAWFKVPSNVPRESIGSDEVKSIAR